MDEERDVSEPGSELTLELRSCLRALIGNPLHPDIDSTDAERLIAMGLVTRWGKFFAVTQAGRKAAYQEQ